jgi:hypothetical protein
MSEREGGNEMTERDARERDILVAANEYAYVQDLTKGDIVLYVGPTKISLSNTERIVELKGDRFVPVRADDVSFGVYAFVTASSAQYIVLENPAKTTDARPLRGSNATIDLHVGRKIVVPGPATFPLWPGQRARVIDGHPLREDEYVVVRYYDQVEGDPHPIGAEIVVRGSDVSFYIPRTGLEVIPVSVDRAAPSPAKTTYVRKAWRFPRPGGLHVRVTKPLVVGEGDAIPAGRYEPGTDVFLKDRDGYFFPSEHVEVLGVVLPLPIGEKEGIYVRDLATGRIATVSGPCNYLPDPTREEVVTRELDESRSRLYGIDNHDACRAIAIYVPPSYAVLVTGKTKREVVVGPQTRILDYDEELETLQLSTGRPKSDETTLATSFLLIEGNKVSDVVRVKTSDHVELEIALSYRVSFVARGEAQPERWFHVKNYVGLLCDHLGSILRAAARAVAIEPFYATSTELLRTAVLGDKKDGPRAGRLFEENGMWVYDVEVLEVKILDPEVKKLLADAQRAAIVADVAHRDEERRLASERLRAQVDMQIAEAQTIAVAKGLELDEARAEVNRRRGRVQIELDRIERVGRAESEANARTVLREAEALAAERQAEIEKRALESRVAAFEKQMAAIAPELVATLKTLGHQQLAAELAKNVGPLAILGGGSVSEIVEKLLGQLPVGVRATVAEAIKTNGNGGKSTRPDA